MKQLYIAISLGIYFLFTALNAFSQVNVRLVGGFGQEHSPTDQNFGLSLQPSFGVDAQVKFLTLEVIYNRSIVDLGNDIPLPSLSNIILVSIDNISLVESIFSNYQSVQFSVNYRPNPHLMKPYVGLGFARNFFRSRTRTTFINNLPRRDLPLPSESISSILFNLVVPFKNFSIKGYYQFLLDDIDQGFSFRNESFNTIGFSINYHLDIINKTPFSPENKQLKKPIFGVNLGVASNIPVSKNSAASFHPWIEFDYYLNTKNGISVSYMFDGEALGFVSRESIDEQIQNRFNRPNIYNKSSSISTAKINYFRNKIISDTVYLFYGPGIGYYYNRRIGGFDRPIFEEQDAIGAVLAAGIKSKFLYASLEWHVPFSSYSSFITFKSGFRINSRKKVKMSEDDKKEIYRRK